MEVFIKDRLTFETKGIVTVLDYTIEQSIYDTVSDIIITTPKVLPNEGDFIFLDAGFLGIVSTVSPEDGKTEIGARQINTLFSRSMFFKTASYTYIEDYIAQLITANFTNCADAMYRLPYLTAAAITHSAVKLTPELDADGTYTISSYASAARRVHNIFLEWHLTRTSLSVDIVKRVKTQKNIDFSNPDYMLTEQDFSVETVGKITTYCTENGQYKDWYLKADGSIAATAPPTSERASGEWITLKVDKAEDVQNSVKDTFEQNIYSHKVSFQTSNKRRFALYDRLLIALDGKLFDSYVSGVTTRKGSDVTEIACGELQMRYPYKQRI